MSEKKPPQKPTNLRPYDCDLLINKQHFTKLEISPYYEKHNHEYLEALKKKNIKLPATELAKKMITDELIQELIKNLQERRHFPEGKYYHWTYYSFKRSYSQEGKAYKLVWCVADDEPKIIGLMDCFRQEKYDKKP